MNNTYNDEIIIDFNLILKICYGICIKEKDIPKVITI